MSRLKDLGLRKKERKKERKVQNVLRNCLSLGWLRNYLPFMESEVPFQFTEISAFGLNSKPAEYFLNLYIIGI